MSYWTFNIQYSSLQLQTNVHSKPSACILLCYTMAVKVEPNFNIEPIDFRPISQSPNHPQSRPICPAALPGVVTNNSAGSGNVGQQLITKQFTKRDPDLRGHLASQPRYNKHLGELFPDCDLNHIIIGGMVSSGRPSSKHLKHPPRPNFPSLNRTRHKKAIKVSVHQVSGAEHHRAQSVCKARVSKRILLHKATVACSLLRQILLPAHPTPNPSISLILV